MRSTEGEPRQAAGIDGARVYDSGHVTIRAANPHTFEVNAMNFDQSGVALLQPALLKLPRIILLKRLSWFQDCESLGLELFDVLEQRPLVALGIHFLVDLAEHTRGIDHEAGPVPVHRPLVLALSDAAGLEEFGVRIR